MKAAKNPFKVIGLRLDETLEAQSEQVIERGHEFVEEYSVIGFLDMMAYANLKQAPEDLTVNRHLEMYGTLPFNLFARFADESVDTDNYFVGPGATYSFSGNRNLPRIALYELGSVRRAMPLS